MNEINITKITKIIKIIIHGDIDLNIIDGCVIWLSNLINTLHQDGYKVEYLNTFEITNENFKRNIINKNLLEIINFDNIQNLINYLVTYDDMNSVKNIIIRSNIFLSNIDSTYLIIDKITFYGLDIHLENLNRLFKLNV